MRTRQGCVDVKHHGRDDFGVQRCRACIGDVVAHADIAPKTREGVRQRGGRDAHFELVLENSSFCSNDGNEAVSRFRGERVSNVNKTVPRAHLWGRGAST